MALRIKGTILGVPIMRIIIFGGLYWVPTIWGNYQMLLSALHAKSSSRCLRDRNRNGSRKENITCNIHSTCRNNSNDNCNNSGKQTCDRKIKRQSESSDLPSFDGVHWAFLEAFEVRCGSWPNCMNRPSHSKSRAV